MILALVALLQVAAPDTAVRDMPRVTLTEALERATRLDPSYVSALGQVDNAEWGRRAAFLAFVLPSINASASYTKSSSPSFNFGTNQPASTIVVAQLDARYELFAGGRKFFEFSRAKAQLEGAEAGELQARLLSALDTEQAYYAVLSNAELLDVARARVARAEDQLKISRARVLSGAAVQSDSLQLALELTRARTDLLRQETATRVARLTLGARIGLSGPADAVPLGGDDAPDLPLDLARAVDEALNQGPQYRVARANELEAAATLKTRWSAYLPTIALTANTAAFDDRFFPSATRRSQISLTASLPIWNNGQREIALTQARVNRDVARAIRADLERGVVRDVTAAYEGYTTARATTELARSGVAVARENFRVQDARYRAGASTILDLLEAQFNLTQAEADLVQARFASRLALAGLEALIGRRLFPGKDNL